MSNPPTLEELANLLTPYGDFVHPEAEKALQALCSDAFHDLQPGGFPRPFTSLDEMRNLETRLGLWMLRCFRQVWFDCAKDYITFCGRGGEGYPAHSFLTPPQRCVVLLLTLPKLA